MSDDKEKNYMLVQDGCNMCDYAKELFKEPIKAKKLIIIDATSEKGSEIVERLEVEAVPVIINEKDDFQQVCLISKDGKKIFCDNGTEKEIIKEKSE